MDTSGKEISDIISFIYSNYVKTTLPTGEFVSRSTSPLYWLPIGEGPSSSRKPTHSYEERSNYVTYPNGMSLFPNTLSSTITHKVKKH